MALEGGREPSRRGVAHRSRFAAIGACLPAPRLSTDELMASTRYEWRQHVPLALRAGLGPESIEAIAGHRAMSGFTDRQRAMLAVCDLLARRGMSDSTWAMARAAPTDAEVVELCLLIGHYQGVASAVGGLAIEPEAGPSTPDHIR